VPAIDATAMQSLESLVDNCMEKGITVIFSHVNQQPRSIMDKDGLTAKVGEKNFCAHIDAALDRAKEILASQPAA
ncbi:MAG: sodium-independent anion transporter, partial [Lachnospiraceae bacterium]|nr:sodium-independent anion transporter [Lachnospiraceae bacterium]